VKEIWIEAEAARIFGMSAGPSDGRLILALHGWSQRNGWHTWEAIMEPLAELGYRVISLDLPGWGRSRPLPDDWGGFEPALMAVDAVMVALGMDDIVLAGKSWGGAAAVAFALKRPHAVTQLVLTAPALSDPSLLGQLDQPILMAWSRDDPVIPYAYAATLSAFGHVQLVSYDHGGHSAAQHNAGDFVPRIDRFLAG